MHILYVSILKLAVPNTCIDDRLTSHTTSDRHCRGENFTARTNANLPTLERDFNKDISSFLCEVHRGRDRDRDRDGDHRV
jgi:hypothetical protein